jgi:hypothetical protein
MWVVRVGGDDGELRPWHFIYVYSIESRLIQRVIYESKSRGGQARGGSVVRRLEESTFAAQPDLLSARSGCFAVAVCAHSTSRPCMVQTRTPYRKFPEGRNPRTPLCGLTAELDTPGHLITAIIYKKYSVGSSIQPMCTRSNFTKINTIPVCSSFD